MPWLYIAPEKGIPAAVMDEAVEHEVGTLVKYDLEIRQDIPKVFEANADFHIIVKDLDKWMEEFHKPLVGR